MKTSETLYAAARYIRKHGWLNHGDAASSACCMLVALYRTTKGHSLDAHNTLRRVTDIHPADFNDFHCKSARDAIAALEIAADIAAAEGN